MGPDPKILDDIARVAGGAVNIVSGLHQQIRDDIRSRMEETASSMNLVAREDFDHACAVMTDLIGRVEALEKEVAALRKGKAAAPKKSAAKPGKGKKKAS